MQESELARLEQERQRLQAELDLEKTLRQRNIYGQFATPSNLAFEVANYAMSLVGEAPLHALEPSCGSGAFIAATLSAAVMYDKEFGAIDGIELDRRFAETARALWAPCGAVVQEGDFLDSTLPEKSYNFLIANPPYVRHHHLSSEQKANYRETAKGATGITPSGLSGLYVYFMLAAHKHLSDDAISAWLIPTEFLDTNYGRALRQYLGEQVSLIQIHRFSAEGLAFDDALVTSSVVIFRNRKPSYGDVSVFSEGDRIASPDGQAEVPHASLQQALRWSRLFPSVQRPAQDAGCALLGDFFEVKRGIATGGNKFFIVNRSEAERLGILTDPLVPILPAPRSLKSDVVEAGPLGWPAFEDPLVLLSSSKPLDIVEDENPGLARYFASVDDKTRNSYIATHRTPWYKVESRRVPPFVLTYMGRSKDDRSPFRVIRNESCAVATNGYLLLYPKGELAAALDSQQLTLTDVHEALRALDGSSMTSEGRVYGGGLRKIEPKELLRVNAAPIAELLSLLDRT